MRFYRLDYRDAGYSSRGFGFYRSRREAENAKRLALNNGSDVAEVEIEVVEVDPTKNGVLKALNHYGKHPDNG